MRPRFASSLAFSLLLVLASGCYKAIRVGEEDCEAPQCIRRALADQAFENVDVLFVIDDSKSMIAEQRELQAQVPSIVRALIAGDLDGDPSTAEAPPVGSIRIGVVSTDLGVGGIGTGSSMDPGGGSHVQPMIPTCSDPLDPERAWYGRDGRLVTDANPNPGPDGEPGTPDDVSCAGEPSQQTADSLPAFLTFPGTALDANEYAARVSCFTQIGIDGCGFEQPLEATLKALTRTDSDLRFAARPDEPERARGHGGDGIHGGWLRDDSLLLVVMLTDEDDCSASDARVFDFRDCTYPDPANPRCGGTAGLPYGGSQVNTRCVRFPELLHPAQRYVDGLLAARGDPAALVFVLIAGFPPDRVDGADEGRTNFDALLGDSRMTNVLLDGGRRVREVCDRCPDGNGNGRCDLGWNDANGNGSQDFGELECVDANGDGVCGPSEAPWPDERRLAVPGRRLLEVARGLSARGVSTVMQSICQEDFEATADRIVQATAERLEPYCLSSAVARDATNRIPCVVLETLPDHGLRCADRPGREVAPRRVTEDGREVCVIAQLPVSEGVRGTGAPPEGFGWFYDDYQPTENRTTCIADARIAFAPGLLASDGASLVLECRFAE